MLGGPAPSVRPRPSGGFSQGMGAFGEHLDEAAMQGAMKQKALQQQQTATPTASSAPTQQQGSTQAPPPPREVGSFTDELVKRPVQDVAVGLASIFDVYAALGIKTTDTPEQQQQKQAIHQKMQQMNEAQKAEIQRRYRLSMEKKKKQQEEEEFKKRQAAQKKQQSLAVPSSPKKGPVGPGGPSKKQSTVNMLNQQRQQLSNPGQQF